MIVPIKLISAMIVGCGSFSDVALEIKVKGKRHKGSVSFENDGRDGEYEFDPPLPPEVDDDFWESIWQDNEMANAINKQTIIGRHSWEHFSPIACHATSELSASLKACGIEHKVVPFESNGDNGNVIILDKAALVMNNTSINVFKENSEKPSEAEFPDFAKPGFDPKKWVEELSMLG